MHEISIVEGIMEAVIPEAEKHGAKKILDIRLNIGELAGIVPECIEEYFNVLSKGTIAEGATITVKKTPVMIECPECGYKGSITRGMYRCPKCNGIEFKVVSGKEYFVESIEAE